MTEPKTNQTQIPGVPVGTKIVRVGSVKAGETYINTSGKAVRSLSSMIESILCFSILEPDNPYNKFLHKVEADIKAAGRERLGGEDDYREPREGEEFWTTEGSTLCRTCPFSFTTFGNRIILKPKTRKVLVLETDNSAMLLYAESKETHFRIGTPFFDCSSPVATYRIEERPL